MVRNHVRAPPPPGGANFVARAQRPWALLPPSARCSMLRPAMTGETRRRSTGPTMGLLDRLTAEAISLKGALRTLKLTTPIAKNPTRVFPQVILDLADKY